MTHGQEEWRRVADFPAYSISSLGRIRGPRGKILKGKATGRPIAYRRVVLCDGVDRRRRATIHTLVLENFIGPRPERCEARHLDCDPLNNRVENLRWGTREENRSDSKKLGRLSGNRKLSRADVIAIRAVPRYRGVHACLAEKFGVHVWTIKQVRNGHSWQHV